MARPGLLEITSDLPVRTKPLCGGRYRVYAWTRFVSMQSHYNLLYREEEREMILHCHSESIGVIPWSPLARGRLARPWQGEHTKRYETDQFGKSMYSQSEDADRKVVDRRGQVAEQRGVARAQLALAWLLSKPATSPIVGATKPHHLQDAVAALSLRPDAGRGCVSRGAVRAASCPGLQLSPGPNSLVEGEAEVTADILKVLSTPGSKARHERGAIGVRVQSQKRRKSARKTAIHAEALQSDIPAARNISSVTATR
jgi:hypothetical protein